MSRNPAQNFLSLLAGGYGFAGGIFLLLNQVMVATPGGVGGMARWSGAGLPDLDNHHRTPQLHR
jgi:hypothetical protein